ncbi:MAG TPA: N-acetylmuramoyl-L-alanine amidase [Verrucomicrobiae bacterium]|jgi:N-acetylmuramoyl-L-alanine amidase|nr:N-acetylmuramoyl-L-alanine amidase [Verrucomicrobiae bacterium]
MKSLSVPILLLGLALFAWPAHADFINGHSYIALASWARAGGFGGYTLNSGQEFVLTNKTSKLIFNQDSADSTINGVNVRLSFPVAKGGFLSQLDAEKTVRPLVYPQKPSAKRVTTICLDPGHGGKDTGYRVGRFFPHYEKTYTLALALELRQQLQQAGFKVFLTRDKDIYPELPVRPDMANRHAADLFVSLHFNSSPNDPASVQGPETYCITPVGAASSNDSEGEGAGAGPCTANRVEDKSLLLAYQVQRSLVRNLGVTDRSVRRARFEVLRTAEMPAILIEGGYMSHPVEGKKIFDAGWRKQMAAALVRAIVSYQKLTAPPRPTNPAVTNRPAIKTVPPKRSS